MRVLVRLDLGLGDSSGSSEANGVTKLLRIEDSGPSVDFAAFLRKIAVKLGVNAGGESTQDEWELYLEGDGGKKALVENTSEIDEGDTLLLRRRPAATTRVKREDSDDDSADGDDECSVETVQYEPPMEVEVIEISDGTDSDDSIDESSSSEEDDEDDEDYEYESDSDNMSESEEKKRSSKPMEPPLQVHMKDQDVPTAPGKRQDDEDVEEADSEDFGEATTLTTSGARRNLNIDQDIKNRIVKLLNTGFHDGSNEHEAKKAMKHAQRLMKKHNLSQALLLKERDRQSTNGNNADDDELLKGGMVEVRIVYRKTQKPSQMARWIAYLMNTVAKNFEVKCFQKVRQGRKCNVTFYGIYTNCQLAAYAYRVAVERISQMAAEYMPIESPVSTRNARLSYALGIEQGIDDEVKANIQREKERRERKLESARKAVSCGEAYEESDDDDDDDDDDDGKSKNRDNDGDDDDKGAKDEGESENQDDDDDDDDHEGEGPGFSFPSTPPRDEGVATLASPTMLASPPAVSSKKSNSIDEENGGDRSSRAMKQRAKISGEKLFRRLKEMEEEEKAALVLVDHREKVADEVLKEHGIKLHAGRKRKPIKFHRASYDKGIIDSKDIDINQRAIRDDWRKKVKKEEK